MATLISNPRTGLEREAEMGSFMGLLANESSQWTISEFSETPASQDKSDDRIKDTRHQPSVSAHIPMAENPVHIQFTHAQHTQQNCKPNLTFSSQK